MTMSQNCKTMFTMSVDAVKAYVKKNYREFYVSVMSRLVPFCMLGATLFYIHTLQEDSQKFTGFQKFVSSYKVSHQSMLEKCNLQNSNCVPITIYCQRTIGLERIDSFPIPLDKVSYFLKQGPGLLVGIDSTILKSN